MVNKGCDDNVKERQQCDHGKEHCESQNRVLV